MRGAPLGVRLRSLRRLDVQLSADAGPLEAGVVQADGVPPLPFPLVTNAPSTWQRLKTAASFERSWSTS